MDRDQFVRAGAEMVRASSRVLVFTGAGLSTESGIADFRSPGGIWSKYDPSEFYFDRFVSDKKAREKYWAMSTEYYDVIRDARPNAAHLAVKDLEDAGKLLAVVTQNIDGLHHKAGNAPDKIIEVHGTVFTVSCLRCGKRYERDEIHERVKGGEKAPQCDGCSGILKTDTISFGQAMPQDKMAMAYQHARSCDLCFALGSSLVVYPAASIPEVAAENGARLIIVNREPTPMDAMAALVINDGLSKVLPPMVRLGCSKDA
jgi:NAD-dependent deacetylase